MFRAVEFNGAIFVIRLTHRPTLSETFRLENHRGEVIIPPGNNMRELFRQIISYHNLMIPFQNDNGGDKTTNELGKELMLAL